MASYKYSPKIEERKQIESQGNNGVIGEGETII